MLSSIWPASSRTAALATRTTIRRDFALLATSRAASFDTWAAFSETRRLWRAFRGRIRFGSGAEAVVRCNRRGGRGGGQVGDSAMKSAESGAGRQRRPGGWWGQASSMSVRKFSHSTNACRSVDAERNRGYKNPGHPIRTLFRPCGRRRHCSHACPCRGRRFHLVSGTSATLVALAPDLVSQGHCQHAALAAPPRCFAWRGWPCSGLQIPASDESP